MFLNLKDVISKLKLYMPVKAQYADPFTGSLIEIDRENLLALLVTSGEHDRHWVSALYAEMGRLERAATFAAALAGAEYRAWKARESHTYRAYCEEKKIKATGDMVTEHYQMLPEYVEWTTKEAKLLAQAGVFAAAREAFGHKAKLLSAASYETRSHERVLGGDSGDSAGPSSLEDLMEQASALVDTARASTAFPTPPPEPVASPGLPPMPPEPVKRGRTAV